MRELRRCEACGAPLPRAAMVCPRCGRPAYTLAGRRSRERRNASVVGLGGGLLMAAQSACMLAGGVIALTALAAATAGSLERARAIVGNAAILVGFALLFDLFGVALLVGAFHLFARSHGSRVAPDPERPPIRTDGFLAMVFLILWILVTLAWRVALVALVAFYPTPFRPLGAVGAADLQRAASVTLGLWASAAILLFVGAVFGMRFLARLRGVTITLPRLLWPLETCIHACAAVTILVLAPSLLANLRFEVSTLGLIETLGGIELVVVPVLGLVAYAFLVRDFLILYRGEARVPAGPPSSGVPAADPPAGEA